MELKQVVFEDVGLLKDKNGKEIHEGDIVSGVNHANKEDVYQGEIKFIDGSWKLGSTDLYLLWKVGDVLEVIEKKEQKMRIHVYGRKRREITYEKGSKNIL